MDPDPDNRFSPRRSPAWRSLIVVLVYLLIGGLWILFSDTLVERLVTDPVALSEIQTWKGWAFVGITGLALYLVLLRQLHRDREALRLQQDQWQEIHRLSQFQQSVIQNAQVWINATDLEGRITLWNLAAEKISGYSEAEVKGPIAIWEALYPDPEYRAWVMSEVEKIVSGDVVEGLETRIMTRHLGERLVAWNSRPLFADNGQVIGAMAIGIDVTEHRAAERELRARERQLATLMHNLPGMAYRCLYDDFWTMKFVSSGCLALTGYRPEDVIDNHRVSWAELIDPRDADSTLAPVERAIALAEPFSLEYRLRRADGEVIWVWERGRAVDDDGGLVLEGIIFDITERKRLEDKLSELATLDALTGQYNRREMERVLDEEVARAARYGRQLAVLWMDLDHFKRVNDTWGHAVGDEVLRAVSLRLAQSIRTVDTLGRFGGEEFLVVLPEMSAVEARDTAERLRERLAVEPIPIRGGEQVEMTISIGVAAYPDHGDSAEALCNEADRAMYRAKRLGRNRTEMAGQPLPAADSDGA